MSRKNKALGAMESADEQHSQEGTMEDATPGEILDYEDDDDFYDDDISESTRLLTCPVILDGKTRLALIDTGAEVAKIRESNVPKNIKRDHFLLDGIGSIDPSEPLESVRIEIELHGFKANPYDFRVVKDEYMPFSVLLGRRFLEENKLCINPGRRRLTYRNGEERWRWYIPVKQNCCCQVNVANIPCVAKEDIVTIKDGQEDRPVPLEISWNRGDITFRCTRCPKDSPNLLCEPLMEKQELNVPLMPGIVQANDLRVMVHPNRECIPTISKGTRLAVATTMVEMIVAEREHRDWEFERVQQEVQLSDELNVEQKAKICKIIFERRQVLSRGDGDTGLLKRVSPKIELGENSPIHVSPTKPVTNSRCKKLLNMNLFNIKTLVVQHLVFQRVLFSKG